MAKDIDLPNESGKSDLYKFPREKGSPALPKPVRMTTPEGSAVELTNNELIMRGRPHAHKEGDPTPKGMIRATPELRALILKRLDPLSQR